MIELDGITVSFPSRRYGAATILDNISVKISEGEWIALQGPNGSGKTTLLKTIAGLVEPAAGRVRAVGGSGTRVQIGLLFQEPDNQFVASSVRDELLMSLPQGVPVSRIEEAVRQFSLAGFLDRNPHRLSGGEKQRLAFATVWLSQPQLLLLDEPTSYLDSVQAQRLTEFIAAMNAAGAAVVWAMPRNGEVAQATRLIRLAGGKIIEDTTPPPSRHHTAPGAQATRARAGKNTTPGETIVAFRDVGFDYGEGRVLTDLSFEIDEGERTALSGRNGSGKSTVLGMIGGLLRPTAGLVHRRYERPVVDGEQKIFYLFQNPERLFFAETVHEEIAFGLRSLGLRSLDVTERVRDALRSADLPPEEFEARMPFSLSTGEMRRVAFAMAWALRPRLLLLDEPTSGLDDNGHAVFARLVATTADDRMTLVTASHDRAMLAGVSDRTVPLPDPAS